LFRLLLVSSAALKPRPYCFFFPPLASLHFREYTSALLTDWLPWEGCLPMTVRKLTAAFVKTAKAEDGLEREVFWDETLPGFGLVVTSSGHRSYVAQYRSHGRSRRYTIGAAKIDLEAARRRARQIFGEVAHGKDPVADKRKEAEADRNSLRAVCERYLAREGGKIRTGELRRATLERLVYPKLGTRQIDDIRRRDVVRLLDDVEDERGPAMADQVLAVVRKIFNWYAIQDDDFISPIVKGMNRRDAESRVRERVLIKQGEGGSDDELRAIWKAAETYPGPWGQFVRYLLLTACRRTEAAAMRWDELSGDLWNLPRERVKTDTDVTLPLSSAAMKVFEQIPRIHGCPFVFSTDGRSPISGFSTFKLRFDAACGVKDWRLHDLRRTARSLLSRAGISPDTAERCLGHKITGVRGVYDQHSYVVEMRHAFEALASQIDRIVNPPPANVVALKEVPA
jgi:integrase